MKQFKIKENGFKEIRNQILIRVIPIFIISAVLAIVIYEITAERNGTANVDVYPFMAIAFVGAIAFGLYRGIKRQKVIYDAYELRVDEESIVREQANTSSVKLQFSDIRKITKNSKGDLVISGDNRYNSIFVPAQLDDIDSLVGLLEKNCELECSSSKKIMQWLLIPLTLLMAGLMAVIYLATNKLIVACSGIILTIILIWSFIELQKSKNVDKKTRKTSYWVLFVIIIIIGITISKVLAPMA